MSEFSPVVVFRIFHVVTVSCRVFFVLWLCLKYFSCRTCVCSCFYCVVFTASGGNTVSALHCYILCLYLVPCLFMQYFAFRVYSKPTMMLRFIILGGSFLALATARCTAGCFGVKTCDEIIKNRLHYSYKTCARLGAIHALIQYTLK